MTNINDLRSKSEITWCPGCTNFSILMAFLEAISELINEGKIKKKDIVVNTGIGCHGKIFDYVNLNGIYGLHGRSLSNSIGVKIANPNLKVINFMGDGDAYAEGLDHVIHAFRTNPDITLIVNNNQVFALTTGQHTPTTQIGFKSKSLGKETFEYPLNPIVLAIECGATFVARGYALERNHLKYIIKEAIMHKGFSFIDVIQPCISFNNTIEYFRKRIYKLEDINHDPTNKEEALKRAREWNYCLDENAKVPIGIFYKCERKTLEENLGVSKPFYETKKDLKLNVLERFLV